MALPFASLSELYNYNNNPGPANKEQHNPARNNNNNPANLQDAEIIHRNLAFNNQVVQDNSKQQQFLQQNQTSGKPSFKEQPQQIPGPDMGRGQNIPPNIPNASINNSRTASRPGWSNITNTWPLNQSINMFNRFQTPVDYLSDHDQLVAILQDISFVLKIIMILIILMFVSKLAEKK